MINFDKENFENGHISFSVDISPVSMQNKGTIKNSFKKELQKITCKSDYIITDTCWINIDYYCQNIKRKKNPSVYDIDNIVKPILDGLSGSNGIVIDDVIFERVTVNWIDTPHHDHLKIEIDYPILMFLEKKDLVILKSGSKWCLPTHKKLVQESKYLEIVKTQFSIWESISTEEDYNTNIYCLPTQSFIYFMKIRDKDFDILDL